METHLNGLLAFYILDPHFDACSLFIMSVRLFILVVLLLTGKMPSSFAVESQTGPPASPSGGLKSAGEFFAVIDAQFQPNWSQIVHPPTAPTSPAREALAFQLGVLVTDAFAAIQANNGQGVKNTLHEITALTKKLNLNQDILARNKCISDFADKASWDQLQLELTSAQQDVITGMQRQKDHDLVVFLLAGSWIRQIDIASTLQSANPKPELAALLAQSSAADELLAGFEKLPEPIRKGNLAFMLVQGLLAARDSMLKTSGGTFPDSAIKELAPTMTHILNHIATPIPRP